MNTRLAFCKLYVAFFFILSATCSQQEEESGLSAAYSPAPNASALPGKNFVESRNDHAAGTTQEKPTERFISNARTQPPAITIQDFATSYKNLISNFSGKTPDRVVQTFSGGLLLAEYFDKGKSASERMYAGHLGNFWAPPFYSAATFGEKSDAGFHTGVMLRNTTRPDWMLHPVHEAQAIADRTQATWFPSKMVVKNVYSGGTELVGTKISLPDRRGFALKLQLRNVAGGPVYSFDQLMLVNIPFLAKSLDWGWGMKGPISSTLKVESIAGDRFLISNLEQDIFMLLGMNGLSSWEVGDAGSIIHQYRAGLHLRNTNANTNWTTSGISIGIIKNMGQIPNGGSSTAQLWGFIGSSRQEVESLWLEHSRLDAESHSDARWNDKLKQLFGHGLPHIQSSLPSLRRLYYNSALQYLLNRWKTLDALAQQNIHGNSIGFFKWTTGTEQFLAMAEPTFLRKLIVEMAASPSNCRAFGGPQLKPYCPTFANVPLSYAAQDLSFVKLLSHYVNQTGDLSILGSPSSDPKSGNLLNFAANRVNLIDIAADPEKKSREIGAKILHDFGDDRQLYELSHPLYNSSQGLDYCYLGGKYTGKVPDLNAYRYEAHRLLGLLYRRTNEISTAQKHDLLRDSNREMARQLWNPQTSWFDTINLYSAAWHDDPYPGSISNRTQNKSTFYFAQILQLLDFPNLLSSAEATNMSSNFSRFLGADNRLRSVALSHGQGCAWRPDWAGPGLYSGSVGLLMKLMFKNGLQSGSISNILEAYQSLAQSPVWAQQYTSDHPSNKIFESHRSWYIESVSVAEGIIAGLIGFNPETNEVWLRPRMKSRLPNQTLSMHKAKAQGHTWDFNAVPESYSWTVEVQSGKAPLKHFRFGWDSDHTGSFQLKNLVGGNYQIQIGNEPAQLLPANAFNNGVLRFTLPKERRGLIRLNLVP